MTKRVSVRDLRNHTAEVVRAIEAGETLTLTVNRRPVADIAPHDPRPDWAPAAVVRAIVTEAPADHGLTRELDELFGKQFDEL